MAEQNSDQEKTEEPTAKRLEQAREEGNVPLSREVSSILLMITALLMFIGAGGTVYERISHLFESFFYNSGMGFEDQDQAITYLRTALLQGMRVILPTLVLLLIVTLLVNMAQTGGVFSIKAMAFKGSKLDPIKGMKKIISMNGLVELFKGFIKLGIIAGIAYSSFKNEIDGFVQYAISPIEVSLSEMGGHLLKFVSRVFAALLVLAIADAVYQRYNHRKQLKMTKQEIKDEYKQMEGDPQVKGWRRRFGMKLRQQKRLDHAVLASDVVVTNPTHYAVALKYDPELNNAPVVMAKGQRLRAQRIKELAKHYGIPIVENKPVARALFATAEEDNFIPEALYRAVAEILAYVYKLKNKHKV